MNGVNPKIKDEDDISEFEMKDIIIYVNDLRNRQKLQVGRCQRLDKFLKKFVEDAGKI